MTPKAIIGTVITATFHELSKTPVCENILFTDGITLSENALNRVPAEFLVAECRYPRLFAYQYGVRSAPAAVGKIQKEQNAVYKTSIIPTINADLFK
jgi:hypothetical protein